MLSLSKSQAEVSAQELFISGIIIILAIYALAPVYWEPGDESLKNWVSARVFRQTGGFPVLYYSPLYNIYLQLFLFFEYPLSLQVEHFVTYLFAYVSIFLLLRRFLSRTPALLLICVWIPMLWTIEGGARLGGIGFLCLYLQSDKQSTMSKGYLPVTLLAAALTEAAYIPCLLGHVIGTVLERRSNEDPIIDFSNFAKLKFSLPLFLKGGMILLVLLTIFFQSQKPGNIVHGFIYPWAPVAMTEAVPAAVTQIANWYYIRENFAESDWIYQDWYLTHEKAFGGATKLLQAVMNNPETFFGLIMENVIAGRWVPMKLILGLHSPSYHPFTILLALLAWIVSFIGLFQVFLYFRNHNLLSRFCTITFGILSTFGTLSLVYFTNRYIVVLLPMAFLITVHIGSGFHSFVIAIRQEIFQSDGRSKIQIRSRGSSIIAVGGSIFIILALAMNEWSLALFLPNERMVKLLIYLRFLDLLLILAGILLIMKRDSALAILKNVKYTHTQSRYITFFILAIAGYNLIGFQVSRDVKFSDLTGNPFLLAGPKSGYSRMIEQQKLLSSVNQQTRVLALEEPWIRAFADADLDKVFHILYLPPFEDTSGETENFLENLDVIWISDSLIRPIPSVATQTYLRYILHLKPFLKKAIKNGWTVQIVERFGKIYRRNSTQ